MAIGVAKHCTTVGLRYGRWNHSCVRCCRTSLPRTWGYGGIKRARILIERSESTGNSVTMRTLYPLKSVRMNERNVRWPLTVSEAFPNRYPRFSTIPPIMSVARALRGRPDPEPQFARAVSVSVPQFLHASPQEFLTPLYPTGVLHIPAHQKSIQQGHVPKAL